MSQIKDKGGTGDGRSIRESWDKGKESDENEEKEEKYEGENGEDGTATEGKHKIELPISQKGSRIGKGKRKEEETTKGKKASSIHRKTKKRHQNLQDVVSPKDISPQPFRSSSSRSLSHPKFPIHHVDPEEVREELEPSDDTSFPFDSLSSTSDMLSETHSFSETEKKKRIEESAEDEFEEDEEEDDDDDEDDEDGEPPPRRVFVPELLDLYPVHHLFGGDETHHDSSEPDRYHDRTNEDHDSKEAHWGTDSPAKTTDCEERSKRSPSQSDFSLEEQSRTQHSSDQVIIRIWHEKEEQNKWQVKTVKLEMSCDLQGLIQQSAKKLSLRSDDFCFVEINETGGGCTVVLVPPEAMLSTLDLTYYRKKNLATSPSLSPQRTRKKLPPKGNLLVFQRKPDDVALSKYALLWKGTIPYFLEIQSSLRSAADKLGFIDGRAEDKARSRASSRRYSFGLSSSEASSDLSELKMGRSSSMDDLENAKDLLPTFSETTKASTHTNLSHVNTKQHKRQTWGNGPESMAKRNSDMSQRSLTGSRQLVEGTKKDAFVSNIFTSSTGSVASSSSYSEAAASTLVVVRVWETVTQGGREKSVVKTAKIDPDTTVQSFLTSLSRKMADSLSSLSLVILDSDGVVTETPSPEVLMVQLLTKKDKMAVMKRGVALRMEVHSLDKPPPPQKGSDKKSEDGMDSQDSEPTPASRPAAQSIPIIRVWEEKVEKNKSYTQLKTYPVPPKTTALSLLTVMSRKMDIPLDQLELVKKNELEGETEWQPISDDTKMYDELQGAGKFMLLKNNRIIPMEVVTQNSLETGAKRLGFVRGAEASTVSDDVQFLMAAEKGNADVILLLLKKQIPITTRDRDTQRTALHLAAKGGHATVASLLVERLSKKAKEGLSLTDKYGWTAMHYAVLQGHFSIAHSLLHAGADIIENGSGETLLHLLMLVPHTEAAMGLFRLLVRRNVNINRLTVKGETALHYAAGRGALMWVMCLMENSATANVPNFESETALHIAARVGSVSVVLYLLQNGSDPEIEGQNGTPFLIAKQSGHTSVMEELNKWTSKNWLRNSRIIKKVNSQSMIDPKLPMGLSPKTPQTAVSPKTTSPQTSLASSKGDPLSPPKAPPLSPRATPLSPPKAPPLSPRATPLSPPKAPPLSPRATPLSPSRATPLSPPGPPLTPPRATPLSPLRATPLSPPGATPLSPPGAATRATPLSPPGPPPLTPPRATPLSPPGTTPLSPPGATPLSPSGPPPLTPPRATPLSPPRTVPLSPGATLPTRTANLKLSTSPTSTPSTLGTIPLPIPLPISLSPRSAPAPTSPPSSTFSSTLGQLPPVADQPTSTLAQAPIPKSMPPPLPPS